MQTYATSGDGYDDGVDATLGVTVPLATTTRDAER
jgi:hypothetical protein